MGTFVAAYLIIWLAVTFYVGLLGVRQHRLATEIEQLKADVTPGERSSQTTSKAA